MPDLALRDDAVLVLVDELDRVFDGDDVAVVFSLRQSIIAASEVDFAGSRWRRRTGCQAALGQRHVLEHLGSLRSSMVGILALIRCAAPCRPCPLDEGVDAERPMPAARSRSCTPWSANSAPAARS